MYWPSRKNRLIECKKRFCSTFLFLPKLTELTGRVIACESIVSTEIHCTLASILFYNLDSLWSKFDYVDSGGSSCSAGCNCNRIKAFEKSMFKNRPYRLIEVKDLKNIRSKVDRISWYRLIEVKDLRNIRSKVDRNDRINCMSGFYIMFLSPKIIWVNVESTASTASTDQSSFPISLLTACEGETEAMWGKNMWSSSSLIKNFISS